ncbi:MAG TPA: choice-of-anchor tandem repeat GloVer-containing protein [Candidatus Sulfotelmatobacter sp.]
MKRFGRYASFLTLFCCCEFACCQNVTQAFSFSNANSSASPHYVALEQGRDGALYGTTSGLGQTVTTDGSVFKIVTKGGKFSALHDFSGADGAFPFAGLTLGLDGNYYGTTTNGGNSNTGALFKVSPSGNYATLYQFTGGSDGGYPVSSPIQASDGNFYGTTLQGSNNGGTVYRYSPSSGIFATIFSFNADQSQGVQILDPLIEGADGNLYGTANLGGANNCGTIFELSISGQLIQIYSFPCGSGGSSPAGPLVQASDGNFYGTTGTGGATTRCSNGCGTIFKMSDGAVSILYSFAGSPQDGMYPVAGLVEGTDGNLYGSTTEGGMLRLGTLFQISKSGQYKQLYSFSAKYGKDPVAGLLQHTNGKFYGTTPSGGTYNEGSLYSLNMGLGPFIALVRYTGRIGQPVQILGQSLTGSTAVTINGVAATSFKVVSDTYMTAVVPTGAATGPVVVTTPTGTLTSNHNLRIVK